MPVFRRRKQGCRPDQSSVTRSLKDACFPPRVVTVRIVSPAAFPVSRPFSSTGTRSHN